MCCEKRVNKYKNNLKLTESIKKCFVESVKTIKKQIKMKQNPSNQLIKTQYCDKHIYKGSR